MALKLSRSLILFCAITLSLQASAQTLPQPLPQPLPLPPAIAAPRDVPYPGMIRLEVDATDINRRIFNVHQHIPVQGGQTATLLFPKWLPGSHWPAGRIDALAGLIVHGGGKRLEWVRDTADVFAFHIDVPADVTTLDLQFQFLTALEGAQGRIVITPEMLNLQWNMVTLYPAGHFTRQIPVQASIKLPEGWKLASALEAAATEGSVTTFKPTTVEQLVDSPLFAGKHFKSVDLGMTGKAPVRLNVFADKAESLEMKPEHIEAHKALVRQAYTLFGSHHYDHYDFLLALTEKLGGIGLEHHQSSENSGVPGYFTDWDRTAEGRDLLPHEYAHSWNGKFRRPADLWTPNFHVPMRDSLLWVYEGQTQYWGFVLAARSGLLSKHQTLDAFAATAAVFDHRIGRAWKPLQDTTNDPITAMRRALPWRSWQRSEDYYSEGQLIWLDVDTLIREQTRGKKSLDDFARAFFGINDGSHVPAPYAFEDVVAALNAVHQHDWATFLRTRLDGHGPGAPLDGINRSGYKLVYTDTPTELIKSSETRRRVLDLTYTLGMTIGREGRVGDVLWDSLAYKLGFVTGVQLIAIDNVAYTDDRMKDTLKASKASGAPFELLIRNGDQFSTVKVDYRDGLRYPRLERDASQPDRFDLILKARK